MTSSDHADCRPDRPPPLAVAATAVFAPDDCARIDIRPREPNDFDAVAILRSLPGVRWGTLALPFTSKERERRLLEASDTATALVAESDGKIVGAAELLQFKGRRSHAGCIGISVHDDYRGRGVGDALLGALIDLADNWLDLRRLELQVFADNLPAIGLYEKRGFLLEGRARAYAFRDGRHIDAHFMARIRD